MSENMADKALRVLTVVGNKGHGTTLTAIAEETGYPVSTTHRLLRALLRNGFVEPGATPKEYVLGLRTFQLGSTAAHQKGFSGAAMPLLRQLTEATHEAALMATLDGDEILYVHYLTGPQQVSVIGEPGQHGPVHCTAMGKVLVAFADEERREELLLTISLNEGTPRAITDRDTFRSEIEQVRERGYATANEEHEAGIVAIGVPVLRPDGTASIALSVAAPSYRKTVDDLLEMLEPLTATASELAARLPAGAA